MGTVVCVSRTLKKRKLCQNCAALQGECSKKDCRYLHKQLPASATVCRAYAQGFCSRGSACMQKHLSPKMLRELRATRTLRAADCKV